MSLDITLYEETSEINFCPKCHHSYPERTPVFEANITHNLNTMAKEAGIYEAMWRPEEIAVEDAKYLVPLLKVGIKDLKKYPAKFKKFNPSNGWGNYEVLVEVAEAYLKACERYPDAKIEVCR